MDKSVKTFLKHTAKDFHNQISQIRQLLELQLLYLNQFKILSKTQNKYKKDPTLGILIMEAKEHQLNIYWKKFKNKLEEGLSCFLTPTGFGSVFLAVFSVCCRPGDEILVSDPCIRSNTRYLNRRLFKRINS